MFGEDGHREKMHQLKSCGVLVVRGEPIRSFLLMVHPTRFDLPKGHVDAGETDIECAMRELREETAIAPEDIELDANFRYTATYQVRPEKLNYQTCNKTLVIFLGRLMREVEIVPTEHIGFEWRSWYPPHRIQAETIDPLLAQLEEYVR